MGPFSRRSFSRKNWVGGWWRLDEVIEPSLQLVCGRAQEVVPVAPTPIEVEADDIDHETSDQVTTKTSQVDKDAYYFRVVRNPVLEVMLLDNNEPMSYEEAMVGPDSDEWLEAIKSERGSMYGNKVQTLTEQLDGREAIEYRWILKGRRTMMVNVTIKKLDLSLRCFSTSSRS